MTAIFKCRRIKKAKYSLALGLLLLIGCADIRTGATEFPEPFGYVTDIENLFSEAEENQLELFIEEFEFQTANEIAILTIKDIRPYKNMMIYATDLGNHWGVGKNEKDNGLFIVVSDSLGKTAIATGLGTQKYISNELCESVIDSIMIPKFKRKMYFDGVQEALQILTSEWSKNED